MTFIATKLFHKAGEGSGGGGGGDQHNLGWYATESALTTAHATATAGDWAIVGATDTVWVWDSDTTAWKDTGQAGIELPSQTGNSGKFLTTDGTDASWGDALTNQADKTKYQNFAIKYVGDLNNSGVVISNNDVKTKGVVIGYGVIQSNTLGGGVLIGCGAFSGAPIGTDVGVSIGNNAQQYGGIAIGSSTQAGKYCLAIGYNAKTSTSNNFVGAIQIGAYNYTNTDANTMKVANANGNFEMMSADGTIPEARLADTTNAAQGQVLTLDANNNAVWATPSSGGGSTSATATLAVADWSGNSQTVNVTGVTASNNVIVAPAPASQTDYTNAGVKCTAQGAGTLSFTCDTTPTSALTVNVLII